MKSICLLLFLWAVALPAFAAVDLPSAVRGNDRMLSDSDARKVVKGFGASLSVTADPDWLERWQTPEDTTPVFASVETLKAGEQAAFLVFFTNPQPGDSGAVNVTYDYRITRPNGLTTEEHGLKGLIGPALGALTNTFLATTIVTFTGTADDPAGVWRIDITVHDTLRKVSIPLRSTFVFVPVPDEKK